MIEAKNVSKVYSIADGEFYALKDVSLTIKDHEFVGILGTSGSGKSTLMHIIGLLDRPTSGQVLIDGKNVETLSDNQLSSIRGQSIGFVFQQFNLIQKLTVKENIMLPTLYAKHKMDFNPSKYADELLERFGISARANFYPNKLSGGQQQRVAIARALIMKPTLVLADEPTGNLDSKTGEEILQLLESLNGDLGVTIAIVTHDKNVAHRTKRQIFVKDGSIVSKY
jgi:putative ABC transport system ATP-binding protein